MKSRERKIKKNSLNKPDINVLERRNVEIKKTQLEQLNKEDLEKYLAAVYKTYSDESEIIHLQLAQSFVYQMDQEAKNHLFECFLLACCEKLKIGRKKKINL